LTICKVQNHLFPATPLVKTQTAASSAPVAKLTCGGKKLAPDGGQNILAPEGVLIHPFYLQNSHFCLISMALPII
jgi:hypothetical protein